MLRIYKNSSIICIPAQQCTMSREFFYNLLVLVLIGVVSDPSNCQDGIVIVSSADIPSDGVGIVPDNKTGQGNTKNSLIIPTGEDISLMSELLGFLYNMTIAPTISVTSFFLKPIFSLVKGIFSPFLAIIDYFLGSFGLPDLGGLVTQIIVAIESCLAKIISNISGILGALFGPQQSSRSKRSVTSTLMSPITTPLSWIKSILSIPWKIASMIYTIITTPLSLGYNVASYPVSGAYSITTWPLRKILGIFGFGGNGSADNSTEPISQDGQETLTDQIVGAVSEAAQDMMMSAASTGFHFLKQDVLPALDSTIESYKDSDIIPESIRGYMNTFHQGYSLLKMLRVL